MTVDLVKLSKTISHALRHAPWVYELELDEEGWTSVINLLDTLREMKSEWRSLSVEDIQSLIDSFEKKRFEMRDGKIRAMYGHSIPAKLIRTPAEPPKVLYHGTPPEVGKLILEEGLKRMQRQYVHLSADRDTAIEVGKRRSKKPIVFEILADEAYRQGVIFFFGNDKVWLANYISPKFIRISK